MPDALTGFFRQVLPKTCSYGSPGHGSALAIGVGNHQLDTRFDSMDSRSGSLSFRWRAQSSDHWHSAGPIFAYGRGSPHTVPGLNGIYALRPASTRIRRNIMKTAISCNDARSCISSDPRIRRGGAAVEQKIRGLDRAAKNLFVWFPGMVLHWPLVLGITNLILGSTRSGSLSFPLASAIIGPLAFGWTNLRLRPGFPYRSWAQGKAAI